MKDHYEFYSLRDKTLFYFETPGVLGASIKVIEFDLADKDLVHGRPLYGVGLRDRETSKKDIQFYDINNNYNKQRLVNTLIEVFYEFIECYPLAVICILCEKKYCSTVVYRTAINELKRDPIFEIDDETLNQNKTHEHSGEVFCYLIYNNLRNK